MHVDPLALEWRPHPRVTWDVLLGPRDLRRAMELDVRQGLTHRPRELPPKYFYDAHGSRLFDAITRLPEYYPTRREREILTARAPEIAARTPARTRWSSWAAARRTRRACSLLRSRQGARSAASSRSTWTR